MFCYGGFHLVGRTHRHGAFVYNHLVIGEHMAQLIGYMQYVA